MLRSVVVGAAVLLAAVAPGAARADRMTIQVTSVLVSYKPIDTKPKGTSNRGDRIVYHNRLVNTVAQFGKPKDARVGTDSGTATFTSPNTVRYVGTTRLPGGTLRIKGNIRALGGGAIEIPVVGGTGRYAKAKGVVRVGPGSRQALNVYVLTLPTTIA
jgi:hypothetical protein